MGKPPGQERCRSRRQCHGPLFPGFTNELLVEQFCTFYCEIEKKRESCPTWRQVSTSPSSPGHELKSKYLWKNIVEYYIDITKYISKDHALFVYFTHHIPHRIQRHWKEQPHTEEPSKGIYGYTFKYIHENIVFYSCYKDFACSGVIGAPQLMPMAVPVFLIIVMDTSG